MGVDRIRWVFWPARLDPWVVAAVVLLANLVYLGTSPLARTEGLRVTVAEQMLETNNWIVPTIFGDVYLRKPPGHPWLLAAAQSLLGAGEWVWRLPSAATTAVLAGMIAWLSRHWLGRVGGLIAGLSYLGLIAMWSQNRSAEIDGPFSAAAMLAALAMACLMFRPLLPGQSGLGAKHWFWMLVLGMSLGFAWLSKGPALVPLILGLLIGPVIWWRSVRPWKSVWLWAGVVLSLLIFGAWALAAWSITSTQAAVESDASGLGEVIQRITPTMEKLLTGLTNPLVLAAYALPLSLALIPALRPRWFGWEQQRAALDAQDDGSRQLLVLQVWASGLMASLVICGLLMLERPRYGYLILPMLCPMIGAVAQAWWDGRIEPWMQLRIRQLITVFLLAFGCVGLTMLFVASQQDVRPGDSVANPDMLPLPVDLPLVSDAAMVVIAVALLVAMVWGLVRIIKTHVAEAMWAFVVVLVLTSFSFNALKTQQRYQRSPYRAAMTLRATIGQSDTVTAMWTYRDQPDLFRYAGVEQVVTYGAWPPREVFDLGEPQWVVFDRRRWFGAMDPVTGRIDSKTAWRTAMAERLSQITPLPADQQQGDARWILARWE